MTAIAFTIVSAILGGFLVARFSKRSADISASHHVRMELMSSEIIALEKHVHKLREMTTEAAP